WCRLSARWRRRGLPAWLGSGARSWPAGSPGASSNGLWARRCAEGPWARWIRDVAASQAELVLYQTVGFIYDSLRAYDLSSIVSTAWRSGMELARLSARRVDFPN